MMVISNPLADHEPHDGGHSTLSLYSPQPPHSPHSPHSPHLPQYPNSQDNITFARYNSEVRSDVTFVAGHGQDTWRFPGHRSILAEANPVFRAMLLGPMAGDPSASIIINDVDKRAFEQLLKYLYNEPVNLPSVATARATLEAANKYICPGLVQHCVVHMDLHLSPSTVLEVFQDLRFFCSRVPAPGCAPSAPPLRDSEGERAAITEYCDSLFLNCLLFIDENADQVLAQEAIEELSYEDISIIAPRDSLKINCEMEFFNALDRWSISECKRCKKELTSSNRRQILGELSYSVRYLLMSEKEFLAGPKASELLDLTECDLILRRMRGDRSLKFSSEQEEMLKKFATPRSSSNVPPIYLSERSRPRKSASIDNSNNEKIDAKKTKKQKKEEAKMLKKKSKEEKKTKKSSCCSCSSFGRWLLDIFVFLFD